MKVGVKSIYLKYQSSRSIKQIFIYANNTFGYN